jgi:hypothetical protein
MSVRSTERETNSALVLKEPAEGGRLEGWPRVQSLPPSFETPASLSLGRLLRMRLLDDRSASDAGF